MGVFRKMSLENAKNSPPPLRKWVKSGYIARNLNTIKMEHAFKKGHKIQPTPEQRGGADGKYTRFVEAFRCVIDDDHPVGIAIIFSDEDILEMVNRRLDPGDRISKATFSNYKRGNIRDDAVLAEFMRLYNVSYREQLKNLFTMLVDEGEKRSWQRYAWLIERKDDRWNLRKKNVDESPDMKQLVFRKK